MCNYNVKKKSVYKWGERKSDLRSFPAAEFLSAASQQPSKSKLQEPVGLSAAIWTFLFSNRLWAGRQVNVIGH